MVKSHVSQERRSRASAKLSPDEAIERVNSALRRLLRNYRREFELIARAGGTTTEFGRRLAEARLDTFQFLLLRFPLKHLRGLTERQRQIALSIAVGMSNKEVGNRLAIKPATVASHLRVIYKKLNVDNRSALLLRILANS